MNTDILGRYPYKIEIDRQKNNHVILGFLKSNSLEKIYQPFNLS